MLFVLGTLAREMLIQCVAPHTGGYRDVFLFLDLVGWDGHVEEADPRLPCLLSHCRLFEGDFDDGFIGEFVNLLYHIGNEGVYPVDFSFDVVVFMTSYLVRTVEHQDGALGFQVKGQHRPKVVG